MPWPCGSPLTYIITNKMGRTGQGSCGVSYFVMIYVGSYFVVIYVDHADRH